MAGHGGANLAATIDSGLIYVGLMGALPTQTNNGQKTVDFFPWPDANGHNRTRFRSDMRRIVKDALTHQKLGFRLVHRIFKTMEIYILLIKQNHTKYD
jgi:hypothetical protein